MIQNISEEQVKKELSKVKHPAVDCDLVKLGIVKNVKVQANKAVIDIVFPFAEIPIKEYLMDSVRQPIEKLGLIVEIQTTVMNEKELQEFLALEKENWKGA
jgi:metal-sulfur cluster biosynthetic enzyme